MIILNRLKKAELNTNNRFLFNKITVKILKMRGYSLWKIK